MLTIPCLNPAGGEVFFIFSCQLPTDGPFCLSCKQIAHLTFAICLNNTCGVRPALPISESARGNRLMRDDSLWGILSLYSTLVIRTMQCYVASVSWQLNSWLSSPGLYYCFAKVCLSPVQGVMYCLLLANHVSHMPMSYYAPPDLWGLWPSRYFYKVVYIWLACVVGGAQGVTWYNNFVSSEGV